MFSAVYSSGITGRSYIAVLSVLVLVIFCHIENAESENINCKNKVRNRWLEYCINDEDIVKRDVGSASLLISRFRRRSGEDGVRVPGDTERSRFPPPTRGDDLGMGMTLGDAEDLYQEMIERMPRAPKGNKEQVIKTLTDYAAKCCNENLEDATCSDPSNVISCP